MALRPPSQYQMNALGTSGTGGAVQSLDHEILGEKAATLGRAGDRVEKALKRLAAEAHDSPQRPVLLKNAAETVYAYFIQRELCGMRRHQDVIHEYGIPAEVLVRLGAS